MSLIIARIAETAKGRTTRMTLPGAYEDAPAAMRGLETILAGYTSHGRNEEQGYWWARDYKGEEFRFVICDN